MGERVHVGWREWVRLPTLGDVHVKAKVDTGARTSALHAFDLELTEEGDDLWADFEIHPLQDGDEGARRVRARVEELRRVKSSTGHAQDRPLIRVPVVVAGESYEVDLTLTSRDEMGFRMLLGRQALRRRFVVDPARSFLGGTPPHPSD